MNIFNFIVALLVCIAWIITIGTFVYMVLSYGIGFMLGVTALSSLLVLLAFTAIALLRASGR